MGDESPQNTMNLDLNLAPVVHPSQDDEPHTMSFEDWLHGSVSFEDWLHRPRSWQRLRSIWRPVPIPMEARNMALGLTGSSGLVMDERNASDDERHPEMIKTDKNGDKNLENVDVGKKDVEKSNGDESSFFDCNICLDLASEPVVTCCGHLFCWPCLYRWLFVHSEAKECPICKGEVTMKNVTPIYSRGNHTHVTDVDSSVKIPSRPQAKRIESWRQSIQRNALNLPMFEMIRRLDNRSQEIPNNSLLNRIFTSRGIRRGQDMAAIGSPDAVTDSPEFSPANTEPGGSTLLARRLNRPATVTNLTSALSSAESFVDSYFRDHPDERNQEQLPLMDDRHSMSSIAAIIQSESQTADTATETDSRVSISTSRRRYETSTSRVSDVDTGDSRSRRRRLQ
ncbi:uncharacterized protein LOC112513696 [Cynara cardunculus var. scolymus]|uniref:E3 ubiquitin-protein ligase RMA n=1 Tax=Cynara cardunculus var. scolymus TaxID=59895 RepID=A0A103Y6S5_CYNCS|nr:uncharacterized protein LOC112513696 [Cynara cardunculus var. scolymus]XP_024975806.1 uncharacterized protein LOC112513696 [Cynara cardunculus var. scolymus]KVI03550.1 hypothetical protein Ccrd_018154 [Cynara cardunculus var. scolymus]